MSLQQAALPEPPAEARAASAALLGMIAAEIEAGGGWISFARYMELALYAPRLGYYSGGSHKFGGHHTGGDFLTAPELTPLFAGALARQVAQVLAASGPQVIEAGAGSGRLAADLLPALAALDSLPERYCILELSGELRARQQATLAERAPQFAGRVEWLDELPQRFSGCLIGNELLDAMPTHALRWDGEGEGAAAAVFEGGVGLVEGGLVAAERPATGALLDAALALGVQAPYRSEISLAARSWVSELARRLEKGALLLIDYGLPRHELYHPQRDGGTLRCHYRHRVHDDPFWFPGLSDITSHVDFTALAEAGFEAGLDVLGFTSQATFLLNCGIGEMLAEPAAKVMRSGIPGDGAGGTASAGDTLPVGDMNAADLRARGAVNVLISPNEMGELFKVIALGRGIPGPLTGFARGDRVHAL